MPTRSGRYWVTWANTHARNSTRLADLAMPFRQNVEDFISALNTAGAQVTVTATRRNADRAYLFHWAWLISQGQGAAANAPGSPNVDIEWDHGDAALSRAGAQEMVDGFGLAVPPQSVNAPSLTSNHIAGRAVDMVITWQGTIQVAQRDGNMVAVTYMQNPNANTELHQVGASYGVDNGR